MSVVYSRPGRSDRECKHWWFDAWDRLVNRSLASAGSPRLELKRGEIAIDPHVHSLFSHCSITQPEIAIKHAVKIGLSAICMMDHNDIRGSLDAIDCAKHLIERDIIPEDFIVIPGVEVNSAVGHIGALFVRENIPMSLSPADTVKAIHDAGGIAVAVHPYHSTGIRDAVFEAPFDAVEVECGSVFGAELVFQNCELLSDPRLAGVTKLGASDAHYVQAVGSCYTVLKLENSTSDSIREALTAGRAIPRSSVPCRKMRRLLGGIPKLK